MKIFTKSIYALLAYILLVCPTNEVFGQDLELCAVPIVDGDIVEVQVRTSGFENIASYQFAVAWELGKYEFIEVGNLSPDLEGLTESFFSDDFEDIPEGIGLIRALWFEPNASSQTLQEDTHMFSVFLQANDISELGQFGIVPHNDFAIEIIDAGFNELIPVIDGPDCGVLPFASVSSTQDVTELDLMVHPNPAEDVLKLSTEAALHGQIQIFNALGQLVLTKDINASSDVFLQVEQLQTGNYKLNYISKDKNEMGSVSFVKI